MGQVHLDMIEKLRAASRDFLAFEEAPLDDGFDRRFKPGFFAMVREFLADAEQRIPTLAQKQMTCRSPPRSGKVTRHAAMGSRSDFAPEKGETIGLTADR